MDRRDLRLGKVVRAADEEETEEAESEETETAEAEGEEEAIDGDMGEGGPTPDENGQYYGEETIEGLNADDYVVEEDAMDLIHAYNPLYQIQQNEADFAQHFYVRMGNRDQDASQTIAMNLATLLANNGHDVNYHMQWERWHQGDYQADELFDWIQNVVAQ